MQILRGRTTPVDHLTISPDSRYVAVAGREELHVWDLHDPDAEPTRHAEPTRRDSSSSSLQFLSDGRLFNVNGVGWQILDPAGGRIVRWQREAPSGRGSASPCGRFVLEEDSQRSLCCWRHSEDGLGLHRELVWSRPEVGFPGGSAFAPDSAHFALRRFDHNRGFAMSWAIHRTADGQPLANFEACLGDCLQMCQFTPDGRKVVAGVRSRVYEWEVRPDAPGRLAVRHPAGRHFLGVAVHPGGATLAGTTNDRSMSLYDLPSGGVLRTYDWRIGRLEHVAFTPDGTRCVVAGSSGKVLLFDVE